MKLETIPAEVTLSDIVETSYADAFSGLGRAAYTLFITPEHEKLHQRVEAEAMDGPPQPLQAPIGETVQRIRDDILPKAELVRPAATDGARLVLLSGLLVQFADYVPGLQGRVQVPYENISGLYEDVTARAAKAEPLGFAEQLDVALEHNKGNLVDSLWQLFITSRLHARWLDGNIVQGMPDYSRDEKVRLMQGWRASIAACKPYEPGLPQDPNGDAYYAWTHTLAKVAYSLAPARESRTSRAAIATFHRGTAIMHTAVHSFNKQGVPSDHTIAAAYGNAIGEACVVASKKQSVVLSKSRFDSHRHASADAIISRH